MDVTPKVEPTRSDRGRPVASGAYPGVQVVRISSIAGRARSTEDVVTIPIGMMPAIFSVTFNPRMPHAGPDEAAEPVSQFAP
jgi:hypothetical protein